MLEAFADVLYPEICLGCGRLARGSFCDACLAGCKRSTSSCSKCGGPRPASGSDGSCVECVGKDFFFDCARQVYAFESMMRSAIHRLKYKGERTLAKVLAGKLAEAVPSGARTLAWVPAPKGRLLDRGYDHSQLLAEQVALHLGVQPLQLLAREVEGKPQVSVDFDSRRGNVAGVFRARLPAPDWVVLIDDVYTTGATASECAAVLRRAGAGRIDCLALARTPSPRATDKSPHMVRP